MFIEYVHRVYLIRWLSGHFGQKKGVKSALKQLQYLAMGPPTGLQMARNYLKRPPKAPTNTAWLYSVPLYIIFGLSGLFV